MADCHRIPYQTPPSSPYKSPPSKSPDVSPPKCGPPRYPHPDPRAQKTSSASGPRVSSAKRGDLPRSSQGSRYAVNRPPASQRAEPTSAPPPTPQRAEPLHIQPLRSIAPTTKPSQKSTVPSSTASLKGKSSKGAAPKADPSINPPTKRIASDMSPLKRPSSDKADDSNAAPVIRSVSVGKKKVTFKHIDLEVFKVKHELKSFYVKFYAPDDDLTHDLIKNYKFDDFHLLTTVGAFEAGLMFPLYKLGGSFYYDVLAHH
ncbi:extensin-like [Papaver somniferum]|uniref:extensin-like n=1 Tax=Papaver somniferum TaxID=3469 RepID=UPI000E6FF96C|nr:extensin-like [Papaver somniferum]